MCLPSKANSHRKSPPRSKQRFLLTNNSESKGNRPRTARPISSLSSAHEIFNRPDRHHDDVARAEALYEEAIALDPSFALAHARLSHLESWSYYAIEPAPSRMRKAREAANEAFRLQPDLAEAHLALGLVYYYLDHDYDRALSELAIARDDLPNDEVVGASSLRSSDVRDAGRNRARVTRKLLR